MINYHLPQNLKLLENGELNNLTIILTISNPHNYKIKVAHKEIVPYIRFNRKASEMAYTT